MKRSFRSIFFKINFHTTVAINWSILVTGFGYFEWMLYFPIIPPQNSKYGLTLKWLWKVLSFGPVPVSSSVALCVVIKLPMPTVFVYKRYELMVIPVRWNANVIRLLREMSLIALRVNFPEHFSRLQTHHLIAPSWPNDGLQFHFLFCDLFFGFISLAVNCYCEDSAAKGRPNKHFILGCRALVA